MWRRGVVRSWLRLWRRRNALAPLLLNGYARIDGPHPTLAFLFGLAKSIMLAQVVANTTLPTSRTSLELVVRILALNGTVNLLQVELPFL